MSSVNRDEFEFLQGQVHAVHAIVKTLLGLHFPNEAGRELMRETFERLVTDRAIERTAAGGSPTAFDRGFEAAIADFRDSFAS